MRPARHTSGSRATCPRRSTILLLLLAACGGGDSSGPSQPENNPAPTLVSVTPAQLAVGAGTTTVTLKGSRFVASSHVQWNGAGRTTQYVDGSTLTVNLTAADL